MKRVILESPYAGDIETHVKYARRALHDCLAKGESPIASHLLFTQPGVLDDKILSERELGIQAGLAWMPVAELIVFYTDYGMSLGMQDAFDLVISENLPYECRLIGRNQ